MLEESGSMHMASLTQLRPRTSETEGPVSQSSSPALSETLEDFGEHGHTGSSWSLYLQVCCLAYRLSCFLCEAEVSCANQKSCMQCNTCMPSTTIVCHGTACILACTGVCLLPHKLIATQALVTVMEV